MVLCDVNVRVYAHREDTPDHAAYRAWVEAMINAPAAYAVADLVLSGFLRVVTHPRVFHRPTPLRRALAFVEQVRAQPNAVVVGPGPRQWEIFTRLCVQGAAKGNLVPDAYLAALALESVASGNNRPGFCALSGVALAPSSCLRIPRSPKRRCTRRPRRRD